MYVNGGHKIYDNLWESNLMHWVWLAKRQVTINPWQLSNS